MLTDLQAELDLYAHQVKMLYDPIWSCMAAEKAAEAAEDPAPVS
jgi:hypothetical protein